MITENESIEPGTMIKCRECGIQITCGLCGKKLCHTVRANCMVSSYYIAARSYVICPQCYIKSHGTLEESDRVIL